MGGFAVHVVITGQVAEGGVVVGHKEGVAGVGEYIGGEDVGFDLKLNKFINMHLST